MAIFGRRKQQLKEDQDQHGTGFRTTPTQSLHRQDSPADESRPILTTQTRQTVSIDCPQYVPYQQIVISNYLLPLSAQVPGPGLGCKTSKLALPVGVDLSKPRNSNRIRCCSETQLYKNGQLKSRQDEPQRLDGRGERQAEVASKLEIIQVSMIDGAFDNDARELFDPNRKQTGYKDAEASCCSFSTETWPKVTDRTQSDSKGHSKTVTTPSSNLFSKVKFYGNSQLPDTLPPVGLHLQTFPLLCLAARYSERVYNRPTKKEKETHIGADWKMGTKAMVIKSLPMNNMNVVVFAIRGSQTFLDWAVNLDSSPVSPHGFLDDEGNLCHAGFLSVARKMIRPVAVRLNDLLQNDPSLSKSSLLITGHSAGGAVAALLYSHMLATSHETKSELNALTACFKRVHCITFGAPPVTLLPLRKPDARHLRKSLFLSFVNEGDPVARAERAYVRTLLDLYTSPIPVVALESIDSNNSSSQSAGCSSIAKKKGALKMLDIKSNSATKILPNWPIPPSIFSNAGKLILLRQGSLPSIDGKKKKKKKKVAKNETTQAFHIDDSLLRSVIWGDPTCHAMSLYVKRIEALATFAVVGHDQEER